MIKQLLRTAEPWCLYYNWAWCPPFRKEREAPFEEVTLWAADGTRLHGWFFSAEMVEIKPLWTPRPVVLFFHGTAGDVVRWRVIAPRWQDILGADVLLIDYRGYGQSAGRPSEEGLRLDALAAYDWLVHDRCYDPAQIVVVGQSLGGAVAVQLAVERTPRALVLESTFTRVTEVANRLGLGLRLGEWMEARFPSIDRLQGFARPLFISHGNRDWLIPYSHAEQLLAVGAGPKRLLTLHGMGHYDRRGSDYKRAVRDFFVDLECPDLRPPEPDPGVV